MERPDFSQYLEYRKRFAVSWDLAVGTLAWAEPLARQALGVHAQRDQLGLGDELQYIPVLTQPATNGGWGELMPVWFRPYERPLPIFILDNWAMFALLWGRWLGEAGSAYSAENLLKIFLGGDLLLPYLPQVQGGGFFLRHGTLPILLGILWLDAESQAALWPAIEKGAAKFAAAHDLRRQDNLSDYMGQIEFEAFFLAEGSRIGDEADIRAFLADEVRFQTYAALFGGLSFSLAALHAWLGENWLDWIFQKVNLDYRLARFGLDAWASWLDIPYVEPAPDPGLDDLFRADS